MSLPLSLSTGTFRGVCKKIDHFPEDADYEADAAEYLLRKTHNSTGPKTYFFIDIPPLCQHL